MNTNKDTRNEEREERCSHYLLRGAIVWGLLYTVGVSFTAFLTASAIVGRTLFYPDILLTSLRICPALCVVAGYLRWRVAEMEADATDQSGKPEKRSGSPRVKIYKKAPDQKAA